MSEPAESRDGKAAKPDQGGNEPLEALDAEFLDYLSTVEGEEDDWTLFEDEEAARQADSAPASKESDKP